MHDARKHSKQRILDTMKDDLYQRRPSRNDNFADSVVEVIQVAVDAIGRGDTERLGKLLEENPSIVDASGALDPPEEEPHYFTGATLLHYVAGNPTQNPLPPNVLEIVRILVDAGADPNATTAKGHTAIDLIASGRAPREAGVQIELIDYLAERGGDVNVRPWRTPLETALMHGETEASEALLRHGAKTDLRLAAGLGRIDEIETYFLEDGTLKPDACGLIPEVDGKKPTPTDEEILVEAFVLAVMNWQFETVDFLLEKGVNINTHDKYCHGGNHTPLHHCCSNVARSTNRTETTMVEFLLERGADPTIKDAGIANSMPIGWAIHNGHPKILTLLLERGAYAVDPSSMVRHAASRDSINVLKVLLKAGGGAETTAGPFGDGTDDEGETALQIAEKRGRADFVALLKEYA